MPSVHTPTDRRPLDTNQGRIVHCLRRKVSVYAGRAFGDVRAIKGARGVERWAFRYGLGILLQRIWIHVAKRTR